MTNQELATVLKALSAEQSKQFLSTYTKHMRAMGVEERKQLKLQRVEWDDTENLFKAYYDGIWWHYTLNGEWY